MADPGGRPQSSGVARRRRERRLRSMLRHERMTVAMALAEFSHHSSRGQKMARAGVWEHEQNNTAKIWKPPTPQPELFSLEEEPGGGLPAPLSEVAGWQERVQRHCVEHLAEVCPIVQILDADVPVPLLVEQYAAIWNMEEDIVVAASRFLSWLSKCPRSASTSSLSAPWFLSRRWRNSWAQGTPCWQDFLLEQTY